MQVGGFFLGGVVFGFFSLSNYMLERLKITFINCPNAVSEK